MLLAQTTESRFALLFVKAKKTQIEEMLNICNLDVLVASWVVYDFVLKNREKFQSVFKENIDVYKHDTLLGDIVDVLKKAQKDGVKLQDEQPLPPEKIHFII